MVLKLGQKERKVKQVRTDAGRQRQCASVPTSIEGHRYRDEEMNTTGRKRGSERQNDEWSERQNDE